MKTLAKYTIKGCTNNGYPTKTRFKVVQSDDKETTLLIHKKVMVSPNDVGLFVQTGHFILRMYRGHYIMYKTFEIKLSTLREAIEHLCI